MKSSLVLLAYLAGVHTLSTPHLKRDAQSCIAGLQTINGRSCTIECQTDRPGGDYATKQVSSLSDCAKACAQDNKCTDAQYLNGFCYLKDDLNAPVSSTQVDGVVCQAVPDTAVGAAITTTTSHVTTSTSSPTSACSNGLKVIDGRQCTVECGMDRSGGDYTNAYTGTSDACGQLCASDSRCLTAQFSLSNGYCYLKSVVNSASTNANVNGYVCKSLATSTPSTSSASTSHLTSTTARSTSSTTQASSTHSSSTSTSTKTLSTSTLGPVSSTIRSSTTSHTSSTSSLPTSTHSGSLSPTTQTSSGSTTTSSSSRSPTSSMQSTLLSSTSSHPTSSSSTSSQSSSSHSTSILSTSPVLTTSVSSSTYSSSSQKGSVQLTSSLSTSAPSSSSHSSSSQETSSQATSSPATSSQATSSQVTSSQATSSQVTSSQATSSQVTSSQATSSQTISSHSTFVATSSQMTSSPTTSSPATSETSSQTTSQTSSQTSFQTSSQTSSEASSQTSPPTSTQISSQTSSQTSSQPTTSSTSSTSSVSDSIVSTSTSILRTTTTSTTSAARAIHTISAPICDPKNAGTGLPGAGGCSSDCLCDSDTSTGLAYCTDSNASFNTCNVDSDCPQGEFCDVELSFGSGNRGECSSGTTCSSTYAPPVPAPVPRNGVEAAPCLPGTSGACSTGCSCAASMSGGDYCTQSGLVGAQRCYSDTDCLLGLFCNQDEYVEGAGGTCQSGRGCDSPYGTGPDESYIDAIPCEYYSDCQQNNRKVACSCNMNLQGVGYCSPEVRGAIKGDCHTDVDCPQGQFCSGYNGMCQYGAKCFYGASLGLY